MEAKMILDIKTKDLATNDIIWGALEAGFDCEQLWIECETNDYDEVEARKVQDYIKSVKADLVITMNFCPTVSKGCYDAGIPYASWLYDSPVQALYHPEAERSNNYFFIFDKDLLAVTKERGLSNLFYLPLAANVRRMGQLEITKEDEKNYSCDVSFVGTLYYDRKFKKYKELIGEDYAAKLDSICKNIIGKWDGVDRLHNSIPDDLLDKLISVTTEDITETIGVLPRLYFEDGFLSKIAAHYERAQMMENVVSFNPRWYGSRAAEEEKIEGVQYYPRLKYEEELPKAYYLTKINLSSTLHSISSGLSLRVFDIMGAGGFIITNYQPEVEELFDVGKEIVVYRNLDELKDLTAYYLKHELARSQILVAGYKRVCAEYTYPVAVKKIVDAI